MSKTLYLIDGHAQIYRAYYAPFGNLNSPSGEPTRATHVFSQMLLNLVRDRKPDYLATVLDVSDETVFRKEIYGEYKSHRDPSPEDMGVQIARIISILRAASIPIFQIEGYEADDIMATFAGRYAGPDLHIYLVSRDKDLDQIVGPYVSLFDPARNEVITPDSLYESKGWRPEQAIEIQTLTGDTVDNIPGVKGIGPKTAAKLIAQYGSAQGVLDNADKLTPKQRENVLAFAPLIDVTRRLVTLRNDVPVELELERAACERFTWNAVRPIFQELGFKRLPEQLPGAAGAEQPGVADTPQPADAPPDEGPGPAALPAPAATIVGRFGELAAALRVPDGGDYRLVNTPESFEEFAAALERCAAFAVDTETTSVSPVDAELVGMSFAWTPGQAYYLPVRSILGRALDLELVQSRLGPILADPGRLKVGHNIKYDMVVLAQARMPLAGPLFDTMIAAFVLHPDERAYKMDALVEAAFGHRMIPITDLLGKGRDQLTMDQAPLDHVCAYAAEDADYTWRLKELFVPQVEQSGVERLLFDVEMPLVSVLAEMEAAGIALDADVLREMSRTMSRRADALTDEIHKSAGAVFNVDSTKQLGEILFDKLGFRVVKRTRTARSTDAETLEALRQESGHPLPGLLLEYRELQKLRSTYVDALPLACSRRTGRVHTSYHQVGAITGRLSSSEPNLQNIPVRTELGREIRRAFVPRDAQHRLIVADYSQVELRILASLCGDEALIEAFSRDLDIHAFVAAQVNGVPVEQVTREMRGRAKAVNFGIIYGQSAFGLAQTTGMSRTDAARFIDDYFARYPRIRRFIDECIETARREGEVKTVLGRRRPLPDIHSRNRTLKQQSERLAVNTVIQGSAADLIKIAMVNLNRRIHAEGLPLRMLLQVHDELVCEAPAEHAPAMAAVVVAEMSGAMQLRVPLRVDASIAENWLEAK